MWRFYEAPSTRNHVATEISQVSRVFEYYEEAWTTRVRFAYLYNVTYAEFRGRSSAVHGVPGASPPIDGARYLNVGAHERLMLITGRIINAA